MKRARRFFPVGPTALDCWELDNTPSVNPFTRLSNKMYLGKAGSDIHPISSMVHGMQERPYIHCTGSRPRSTVGIAPWLTSNLTKRREEHQKECLAILLTHPEDVGEGGESEHCYVP